MRVDNSFDFELDRPVSDIQSRDHYAPEFFIFVDGFARASNSKKISKKNLLRCGRGATIILLFDRSRSKRRRHTFY